MGRPRNRPRRHAPALRASRCGEHSRRYPRACPRSDPCAYDQRRRCRATGRPSAPTGPTGWPGRASLSDLSGRSVVLWPDNDDVGRKHMDRIADRLAGIAASVRRIDWPEAPEHGDAADYVGDPWDLIDALPAALDS